MASTWFHPHNVQMKGQLGVRRAKSTLSLLRGSRNCQTVVVTGIRALVSPGYACAAPGLCCWIYRSMKSGDLPAVLTFAPACGWLGDSQGVREARSCLLAPAHGFPLLWPEGFEVAPKNCQNSHIEHLTSLTASGNTEQCQQKHLWDDIFMHWWDVLNAYLLHLDSRLMPKAEETNLNFLQLAYSWVPCVSKTCLIMWLPDVFFRTTSKGPTLTHSPNNKWKSPLLLLQLFSCHWKQTVCKQCWNNSLCTNSGWKLASDVAELGTLKLNMNSRSEKILQEKVGIPFNQSCLSCGLCGIFCFLLLHYLAHSSTVIIPLGPFCHRLGCPAYPKSVASVLC